MRPNITIVIAEPYVSLKEYCRRTGTAVGTARDMVRDGRLPVKSKQGLARGAVQINMAALMVQALSGCSVSVNV